MVARVPASERTSQRLRELLGDLPDGEALSEVMQCAPICAWDLPAGIYDGDGDVTDQDGEDSPDHPGHGWRRRVGQLCLPVARPVRALLPQVIGVAPYGRSPGAL